MTSISMSGRRHAVAAAFAATLVLCTLSTVTHADTADRASPVRDAIVALSIADAAMPVALAVAPPRDERPAQIPASSDAMKPENASAMAAMRSASARGTVSQASYDRRVRARDPFVLILGIAY